MSRTLLTRNRLKDLLIALYLAGGGGAILARYEELGVSTRLALYAVLFGLCVAGLLLAARIPRARWRLPLALALSVSAVMFDASLRTTGDFLTYGAFVSLFNARAFLDEALAQYGWQMLPALGWGVLLFAGLALPPEPRPGRLLPWVVAPAMVLVGLVGLMFLRGGDGGKGLPGAWVPLAYSVLLGYEQLTGVVEPRRPVQLPRTGGAPDGDIVLIVDESVAPQYLDLFGPQGVFTGLLDPPEGVAVFDLGHAAAITHCSHETNHSLRFGGTRDNYLRMVHSMPSIWAYAHAVGLRTVYLDGQRTGGRLQNGMDEAERAEIDEFVQLDGVPVVQRDQVLAERLVEHLKNGIAEFIYVNKVGAHFPVSDKYPVEGTRYRPVLPRGRFLDISDTGSREGFSGDRESWIRYRNAYRNTLAWNVGGFFVRLLPAVRGSGAVLIYTSDHGQDLHEDGHPGVTTHCSPRPRMEEGVVPLVVIQDANARWPGWQPGGLGAVRDGASHYRIFPTLLALMGYEREALRTDYGRPLDEGYPEPLRFNTNWHARLGRKPVWQRIDPARLARPPVCDYRPCPSAQAAAPGEPGS